MILGVQSGSAADRAGLQPTRRDRFGNLLLGDIITALDGSAVRSSEDLFKLLDDYNVGDAVEVTVIREDRERKFKVTLQALD